ncbi:hydrogenase 4 subunit B [Methylacidimicrobium tartarophylax]|uniref:NADH-quinone oxidoreductase subunit L n=1 Tax=Methylacidimicrobium tartarophylax TaxID=1041768 RepID=A0A5E6MCK1_9BACT|nr:hydrogenase 4 subunit B [Methylacidimicrobium tartarophylax]VVM06055.1 NADH-quinone oxidoreductase subunit L [Methylacidimicrobium tartarophylax]
MTLVIALGCSAALLLLGIASLAMRSFSGRSTLVYAGTFAVSLISLASSLAQLLFLSGVTPAVTLPVGLPWLGAHFRMDALSSLFLAILSWGGVSTSLFALGYGRHEPEPGRILPFFPLFLTGMSWVILADDAYVFLFAWELMSVTSWALVVSHHREEANLQAGHLYLIMAVFGGFTLLLAFGLLANSAGSYAFSAMRSAAFPSWTAGIVLLLATIGAGSKAGLFPLHVWLPQAHPAAPSHVSALMSGVMTKVAVYGFVRIVFDLLRPHSWESSLLLLFLGGVTAVLGVLYALMQHDLKRLLAYHTVENIGIIFIGLGLALAFATNQIPWAAALSLTAALFHTINHSLFKSLLFLGSGAVLAATGERDMGKMGGLIHRMPGTTIAFLLGSVAISALPPLNGFASEWLTFQAILVSPNLPQWALKFLIVAVGALLALSAALAAACFVKAFGMSFLGRPRSLHAAEAKETDRWSLSALFLNALLCLLAGLFPGSVVNALGPVVQELVGQTMPQQSQPFWTPMVPIAQHRSSYDAFLLFILIVLTGLAVTGLVRWIGFRPIRRSAAWDCGYPDPSPVTQYTTASFAQPIRRVYASSVFGARETVDMPLPGEARPARVTVKIHDPAWQGLYAPIIKLVWFLADRLNPMQFLTIRRYLLLGFLLLVFLLLLLSLWI